MTVAFTVLRLVLVVWLLRMIWAMARLMVNEFR